VFHLGDIVARQEYFVTDTNFTYTYDKNFDDGLGSPSRTVSFKVWAVGSVASVGVSGESTNPAKLTATNPQPALPTSLVFSPRFQTVSASFIPPVDNDYAGVQIWMDTTTGFTKDVTTLVYDGPDSTVDITGLANGIEYFFVLAPYDGFGKVGVNYSIEYSATTNAAIGSATLTDLSNWARELDPVDLTFITANMATSAIPSTHIENLVAGKIAAGTIASVVNISGVFTAVGGGTPEAVFNKTLAAGDWRMDMGPVTDTGATYLLRYYNGYDDAHGSYAEAFSVDESGSAKFTGGISGSNIQGTSFTTTGSYLTAATVGAETTLYVYDTTDFATSGSGWLLDSTNDRDVFSWTGKTNTTLTGCSGVLAHIVSSLVIPLSKQMLISEDLNEMRFYGDRGDSTIIELASIGIVNISGDNYILSVGDGTNSNIPVSLRGAGTTSATVINYNAVSGIVSSGITVGAIGAGTGTNTGLFGYGYNSSTGNYGVRGSADTRSSTTSALHIGIWGRSGNTNSVTHSKCIGVYGTAQNGAGYGGVFESLSVVGGGPIKITPASSASAPTHTADGGTFWVTSGGDLYFNKSGGTTWTFII
jgi:hypothetical protein